MINSLSSNKRQCFYFALSSAVITVFGLLVGLTKVTNNYKIILISVLSLAISNGLADGFSIYISKKAEKSDDLNSKEPIEAFILTSTIMFFTIISFLIPFLFTKNTKYFNNLIWPGLWTLIIILFIDYNISNIRKEKKGKYFLLQFFIIGLIILIINNLN